jgi:glycosyltransferase involved in cell wall biosynthesis
VCIARLLLVTVWLLLARRTTALVWTAHDLEHPDRRHPLLDRFLTNLLRRVVDAVIVHDDAACHELATRGTTAMAPTHVVPHGSYIGHYANETDRKSARAVLGLPDDAVVFLVFGWIRRYKNVGELLLAFRQVQSARAHLVIAGAVPASYGEELVAEAAHDSRVHCYFGAVRDEDVQIFMNASDAVVLPYSRVLTSGAAVLAQSFGKACIVPANSGVDASLPRGGAIRYNPASRDALVNALQEALDQQDHLPSMGQRNYACAAAHAWHDVAAETVQVYVSVVSDQRFFSRAA